MIWDANYIKDMERFDSHGCSRMFDHVNGAESVWPLAMNEEAFMEPMRADGLIVRADTIEGLAEGLGIKIDTNLNVLDQNDNPIEGLYCAGDCSGGYFATSYPNLLAGAAAGRSVTFGRLAGRNAANRG